MAFHFRYLQKIFFYWLNNYLKLLCILTNEPVHICVELPWYGKQCVVRVYTLSSALQRCKLTNVSWQNWNRSFWSFVIPLEKVLTTTINVAVGESTDKPPADRVVGNRGPSWPRGSEQRSKYLVTDLLARIKLITNSLATGKRCSQAPHLSIAQHIHTDAEDKKTPQRQKLRNWTGTTCCLRNNSNPVILDLFSWYTNSSTGTRSKCVHTFEINISWWQPVISHATISTFLERDDAGFRKYPPRKRYHSRTKNIFE